MSTFVYFIFAFDMSKKSFNKTYLFIDESGDPVFQGNRKKLLVGTEGYQPFLIIGMIETENRKALRKAVVNFMDSIKSDSLYNSIPSIAADKGWYVHARGDHPENQGKVLRVAS